MEAIFSVHTSAVRSIAGYYARAELDVWSGRNSPDAFAKTVSSRIVIVEEDERTVRGFAQLDLDASIIEAVYVAPAYWRRRIGSRLLAELEAIAFAAGKMQLNLDASLNSVPFYERTGYSQIKHSSHELSLGTSIACVIMQKRLPSAA